MKKNLFIIASVLLGTTVFGQFTTDNAPAIGDNIRLYVIDSLAPDYANITGNDVTWDYSTYEGYGGIEKQISIKTPSATTYGSDFPSAQKAYEIEQFVTTYYQESQSTKMSNGYSFSSPTIGNIIVRFENSSGTLLNFPFNLGDNVNSIYSGKADMYVDFQGTAMSKEDIDFTGSMKVAFDGIGTLKLAGQDFTDVYRYVSIDTVWAPLDLGIAQLDVVLYRTQFEYYHFETSKLPIFIHSYMFVDGVQDLFNSVPSNIVMSYLDPTASVITYTNDFGVKIYPNPAQNVVNITKSSDENLNMVIVDQLGRTVYSSTLNELSQKIDVSNFAEGMYFVKLTNGTESTTQPITIK